MSRPQIELPVETDGFQDHKNFDHPAFAQIRANRVQGNMNLYDSDFTHGAFVTLAISRSTLSRGLSSDRHYARDEIIEVALSEAQWATFVSSMNVGGGVPCTITHIERKGVARLPDPISRVDQFSGEVSDTLVDAMNALRGAMEEIDASGLSKKKADSIKDKIRKSLQEVECNLPFVAEQFSSHAERTIEKAKAEIHGHMTGVIQRSGIEALQNAELPLMIEHKEPSE